MDESLIYRKTRLGATELAAATHGALSPAARRVLILLDGRRSVAELAELFGAPEVERVIFDLVAQGFAREVDPQGDPQTTQTVSVTVPGTASGTAELAPLEPAVARRRGALTWVIALVGVVALGAGAWFGVHSHIDNTALAAAQPDAAGQASQGASAETPSADQAGTRELPLSGLPPVTVTLASTSEGRRARALAASQTEGSEAPLQEAPEPKPAPRLQAAAARPAPAAAPAPAEQPTFPPRSLPAASAPAPEPVAAAPHSGIVPVANSGAEATKLAAVASGAPRSDASGSAVETATAAAVASRMAPQPAALPTAAVQSPASVTPVAATGFADAPASAPALRAAAGGTEGAAPAAAEGQQLASVAPPPRPQSAPAQLRPRRHDAPEFPARAMRAHVYEGHVLARISITAEGKVDQVDIVKATPARMFDDEVKRTLSKWTFEPPGRATDTTVEFDFKP